MSESKSLFASRPRAYEIRVCSVCRASIKWFADDGEGMWPRGECRGPERHLVVDALDEKPKRDPYPLTITVQEVEVA